MIPELKNTPPIPNFEEIFYHYLPEAKIDFIDLSDVPPEILKLFEWTSSRFISPQDYRPGNVISLGRVDFYQSRHYGFEQQKSWPWSNGGEAQIYTERNIQLIGADSQNKITGRTESVQQLNTTTEYFANKPIEMCSGTEEPYIRQGLSITRTIISHALTRALWNLPLYSSTHFLQYADGRGIIIQPQKLVWEKLVKFGLATKFSEDGMDRYVFNDQTFNLQSGVIAHPPLWPR